MPPASKQATNEQPGKRRTDAHVALAQDSAFCISIGSYTLPDHPKVRKSETFALLGAGAKRPCSRGSPNSAFEAGNRLLQYVVAQVSEDAANGSTVV